MSRICWVSGVTLLTEPVTPFDVLKTRLQTVQPHPRHSFDARNSGAALARAGPEECCQTSVVASSLSASSSRRTSQGECLSSKTSAPRLAPGQPLLFSTLRTASPAAPVPDGCLHPSKWAGIWGEAITLEQAISRTVGGSGPRGGAGGTLVLAPGFLGQSSGGPSTLEAVGGRVGGFWTEAALVFRDTGVRGLWKGVGTTMAMSVPSSAIYMLGYEHLLGLISPYFTGSADPSVNSSSVNRPLSSSPNLSASSPVLTPAPLLAGSLARTLSATVISPIEMFRTRLQALPSAGRPAPSYASTTADLAALVRSKGPTILWRGLGPTLWRDVPFSGLYWANFEILKSRLTASAAAARSDSERGALSALGARLSPTGISFVSGALSGIVAALLTQPFDVLKTRRQVFTPSKDCSPAALKHRASTLPLAAHVVKTEGWQALFAGLTPRIGKVAPACGLMIACYEGVGRWLGEQ